MTKSSLGLPIDEETAGKVLSSIYEKACNGIPGASPSVDELVDDYLGSLPNSAKRE